MSVFEKETDLGVLYMAYRLAYDSNVHRVITSMVQFFWGINPVRAKAAFLLTSTCSYAYVRRVMQYLR